MLEWYRLWGRLPVISWVRAAQSFQAGDFAVAEKLYSAGLAAHARHPAANCARIDRAYCYYRRENFDDALEELLMLCATEHPLREGFILLARIQSHLGWHRAALTTIKDGLGRFPNDLRMAIFAVHQTLFIDLSLPELPKLIGLINQFKHLMPLDDSRQNSADAALAHYEWKCGSAEVSERTLSRVLATGAAPVEAILIRGEQLIEQGRLLQGREQLTRAAMIMPRNPEPHRLLAESYIETQPDWAVQLATVACRSSHWQNTGCLEVLTRAYHANGDDDAALLLEERMKALDSSRELAPGQYTSVTAHHDRAKSLN